MLVSKFCGKKIMASFVIFLMITFMYEMFHKTFIINIARKHSIYYETRASNFSFLQIFFHHLFILASGFRHEVFKPIHTLVKVVYFLTHSSSCKRLHKCCSDVVKRKMKHQRWQRPLSSSWPTLQVSLCVQKVFSSSLPVHT